MKWLLWQRACWLGLCVLVSACGGKTGLSSSPRSDGGTLPDTDLLDGGLLRLECPRGDQYTSPRRPITLNVTVTSPDPPVTLTWRLIRSPPRARPTLAPTTGSSATLTPDVAGDYAVRLFASDDNGHTAACEVVVHSVVGPPVAICPEGEITVLQNEFVDLLGDGYDDDGIVSWRWRVLSAPAGGSAFLETPDDRFTRFRAVVPGDYMVQLAVTDVDGAVDTCRARVRVMAPPVVTCPAAIVRAPTRRAVDIRATASDDRMIRRVRWEVTSRPAASTAEPAPPNRRTTSFAPDKQGRYTLVFTATDDDGLSSSCEVRVIGLPTPPDATCPATVDTTPLTTVTLTGAGVDDGDIVSYRWRLVSGPMGSAAAAPAPVRAQMTRFTPDIVGEYRIELRVTDNDGQSATCTFLVRAVANEGLRIEMFWDTNGTDMDTHLIKPEATAWFNTDDCYYANCTRAALPWGMAGPEDDPRLDIDNTSGFGPENINIDVPYAGIYRVGIHSFRGGAGAGGATRVTVRIYCGASATTPRRTFGPVGLRDGPGGGSFSNDFWRVADVEINAAGGCTIRDLARRGVPNITRATNAQTTR